MKGKGLDTLDKLLISIIQENEQIIPSKIYDKAASVYPRKINRAIVWSRLITLVESGNIGFIETDENEYVKPMFVIIGKP